MEEQTAMHSFYVHARRLNEKVKFPARVKYIWDSITT